MICHNLSSLLGFVCHPLVDDGSVAMVETSFKLGDGDAMPIYIEHLGTTLRFFDDGQMIRHFLGRGLQMDDQRKTRFLKATAEPYGVQLSEAGDLEIYATLADVPVAFAAYMSALVSLGSWEREQQGADVDPSLFVDEVALYLQAWKPKAEFVRGPEYVGISGVTYRVDFGFDGKAVVTTGSHHSALNSAVKKLLDIRSQPVNSALSLMVVLDDRGDKDTVAGEILVLQTVADVMPFTTLAALAGSSGVAH